MTIRWLHLSDVHECKKEGYHREAMYDAIVAEVSTREQPPDLVFITGDLAFAGTPDEYELLQKRFFEPFKAALPSACAVFMVPGNHDVDRPAGIKPRLWASDDEELGLFQEVGSGGIRKRRDALLPRFAAYCDFEQAFASWNHDWLSSESGSICQIVEFSGKKVAIVGINTAWLCQDSEDWGKLTAGRTMVDAAFQESRNAAADATIVLGHHPLDAMTGELPWSDGKRIRERLRQANAVYLHGHLHAGGNQRTGDSLQSVLAIQAPSAFQAGDNSVWRNGLMWGEIDLDGGWLIVEPLKWSDDDREYKFDTDAGLNRNRLQGRDAFRFRLPGHEPNGQDTPIPPPEPPPNVPPPGWRLHDRASLRQFIVEHPDPAVMADYFDGSLPTWQTVLAEGLQPRQIVDSTIRRFRERHRGAPRPLVVLLTGAGGEGKSTALLQVAAGLACDATQSWSLLHREAAAAEAPETLFAGLEARPDHSWIVALDDAENAAGGLANALRRIAPRTDVHLVLAAREADWSIRGLKREIWHDVAEFRQEAMPGLDEVDAHRIVEGWHAFGDTAMGRLRGTSVEVAAKALWGHANEQAARPGEGALLGALLFTRQGEELKDRVRRFVAPLTGRGTLNGRDLRDVYAMIAAMHAENQLYLSRVVLAGALGCDDKTLDNILYTLRREAMLDSGETFILTRHRRIADTAIQALTDDGYDVRRWFPVLARAAEIQKIRNRIFVPSLELWRFALAEHFIGKGEASWPLAREIAKAIHDANPRDPKRLVSYVNVLRESGDPGTAMAVLRANAEPVHMDRGVLFEWSVVAGAIRDYGLAVWLASRSLADGGEAVDAKQSKLSLAGLGKGLERLHGLTGLAVLAEGRAACGRLGLRLRDLDATARGYFEEHSGADAGATPSERSPEADVDIVHRAVMTAADEAEAGNDPAFFEDLLGDPQSYRFSGLLRVIGGEAQVRRRRA